MTVMAAGPSGSAAALRFCRVRERCEARWAVVVIAVVSGAASVSGSAANIARQSACV